MGAVASAPEGPERAGIQLTQAARRRATSDKDKYLLQRDPESKADDQKLFTTKRSFYLCSLAMIPRQRQN